MRVTMQKPATLLVVCLSIIMLIVPATSTATAQESATSSTDFSSLIRGDRLMTVPGTTVVLDPATGDIVDVIFPSKAQTTKSHRREDAPTPTQAAGQEALPSETCNSQKSDITKGLGHHAMPITPGTDEAGSAGNMQGKSTNLSSWENIRRSPWPAALQ